LPIAENNWCDRPLAAASHRWNAGAMDQTLAETMAGWRRHLHANPELSLYEKETATFVCARLAEIGIPHVAGVGGHGVVATLSRGQSNRSVGLRADMDALPITETTGLPHASKKAGVMHACGHDGHTASLLGAAALLARDQDWSGTVHLVFQPAEEGYGGARAMLDAGLFERFPMERIFGYHNWPGLAAGTVAVHDGPVMAGGARLEITLDGHAGHAAMPHQTRDPMLAAGHLLVALQSVVSRNIDPLEPAVVSICMVDGGVASNQIPSRVTLRGTCRAFRPEVRAEVDAAIRRVTEGIAATFGMRAGLDLPPGLAATVNHTAEAELAAEACAEAGIPLRRDLKPAMTGEDFAWFLQERPGAFVWIGNGPAEAGRELHNPNYDYNDAILPNAAGFLAAVAKRALAA
jgi:hippurate hydrolase